MQRLQTFDKQRGNHLVLMILISENFPKYRNLPTALLDGPRIRKFLVEKLGVKDENIT